MSTQNLSLLSPAHRNLWLWFGLLLVVGLIAAGCSSQAGVLTEAEISQAFDTSASPRVVVENFNGKIEVNAGPAHKVTAQVLKRAMGNTQAEAEAELRKIEVTIQQQDSTIRVVAKRTGLLSTNYASASIRLIVPARSRLDLHTNNDDILVSGVSGNVRLATANGDLKINGGQGQLQLQTNNGEIQVEAQEAVINAETANGNVIFKGTLAASEQSFVTDNGSIEITLPANTGFRLNAETHNGRVLTDFSISESGPGRAEVLKGIVGENPTISITAESSNGSIAFYRG